MSCACWCECRRGNRFRSDLDTAAIGGGRFGFELKLCRPLPAHACHDIRVRCLADGWEVAGSPLAIEPFDRRTLDGQTRAAIDRRLRATQQTEPGDDRLLGPGRQQCQRAKRALIVEGWVVEFVASAELAWGYAVAALKAFEVLSQFSDRATAGWRTGRRAEFRRT